MWRTGFEGKGCVALIFAGRHQPGRQEQGTPDGVRILGKIRDAANVRNHELAEGSKTGEGLTVLHEDEGPHMYDLECLIMSRLIRWKRAKRLGRQGGGGRVGGRARLCGKLWADYFLGALQSSDLRAALGAPWPI